MWIFLNTFLFFLFARGCLDFCVRYLHNEAPFTCCGLLQAGQRQVAGQLNICVLFQGSGTAFNKLAMCLRDQRSGRPRCATARQDRYLGNLARRQRFQSTLRLNSDFRHRRSETDFIWQIYALIGQL